MRRRLGSEAASLQGPELEVAEGAPLTPVEREHDRTFAETRSQPDGFTEGVRQSEVRGPLADTDARSDSRCGDVIGCDPKPYGDRIGNLGGELERADGSAPPWD